MTSNREIPVTLRPGRVKAAALFLVCLLFVLCGVWMGSEGNALGYLCGGFFALGLPVFALQFHPKAAYLKLAADEFTYCALFRVRTVRWEHVSELGVIQIHQNRMVAWNFVPGYQASARARAMSKSMCGYEAALPDTYGMKAPALAEGMESLRRRYLERRDQADAVEGPA